MVKDTEKNKSHVVFAEIVAQRPQNLRMDVTTSLGIHLARLTMNENTLSYLLPREKKYFSGAAGPKVLKPILKIQLDPRLVMSLLFDVPPQEGTWNCERDAKERLKSCVSEESGVELTWTEREAARKTVAVKTEAGFVQLQLTGYQPNVEVSEEMFHLKAPPGFKVIRPSTTSSSNTATE